MKITVRRLIIIAMAAFIGIVGFVYIYTNIMKHEDTEITPTHSKENKLEKVSAGDLLTPQQIDPFSIYGSTKIDTTFYKPISMEKVKEYFKAPFNEMNFNIADNLPFKVGKAESYIVQVKINDLNKMKNQVHFVYLKDKNTLGNYGDEFIVISVYEMDQDKIDKIFELIEKKDKDIFGNTIEIIKKDGLTFASTKISKAESLTYSYYQFNNTDNKLTSNTSVANKIITEKNGFIYDVGYHLTNSTKAKEDEVLYSLINFINAK